MKNIFLLITLISLSVYCTSQDEANKLFPINTYINNTSSKLPADVISLLSNKINAISTNTGIGGDNNSNPRFILYAKVQINKKNVFNNAGLSISIYGDLYFFIGDAFDKTLFSNYILPIKGFGSTEESAITDAIKSINPKDEKFRAFVIEGEMKIKKYFQNQCPIIISKAKSLAAQNKYEEAIYNLYSIPEVISSCYPEAHDLIKNIYNKKNYEESAMNLKKAQLLWVGSQDNSRLNEILGLLEKVNPSSPSFIELENLIKDIGLKIQNNILRDWMERQSIRKDEIEKEKYRLELEKIQIESIKQIAIAYASGIHITNNTSNNFNTNYSTEYFTKKIYESLYW